MLPNRFATANIFSCLSLFWWLFALTFIVVTSSTLCVCVTMLSILTTSWYTQPFHPAAYHTSSQTPSSQHLPPPSSSSPTISSPSISNSPPSIYHSPSSKSTYSSSISHSFWYKTSDLSTVTSSYVRAKLIRIWFSYSLSTDKKGWICYHMGLWWLIMMRSLICVLMWLGLISAILGIINIVVVCNGFGWIRHSGSTAITITIILASYILW